MVYDSLSPAIRATIGDAHPVPIQRLVDFERVSLAAGASKELTFGLPTSKMAITTAEGAKQLYPGVHTLVFSRGNGADVKVGVTV